MGLGDGEQGGVELDEGGVDGGVLGVAGIAGGVVGVILEVGIARVSSGAEAS